MVNPTVIRQRSQILFALREWFHQNGYMETHTPIYVPSGALEENLTALPFGKGYLHTSPEFGMKKLLAAGLCRIYQIVPCFRGDEFGNWHSQEFTMLEWYRVGAGTQELIADTIDVITCAAKAVEWDIPNIHFFPTSHFLSPSLPPEEWFYRWVDEVEPRLKDITIIYDYPTWQSALAKIKNNRADRFEVYINGVELANAFNEELDGEAILKRWKESNANRMAKGNSPHPIDYPLIQSISTMPRCSGIAMGIDRLVMILTGVNSIQQTQLEVW